MYIYIIHSLFSFTCKHSTQGGGDVVTDRAHANMWCCHGNPRHVYTGSKNTALNMGQFVSL